MAKARVSGGMAATMAPAVPAAFSGPQRAYLHESRLGRGARAGAEVWRARGSAGRRAARHGLAGCVGRRPLPPSGRADCGLRGQVLRATQGCRSVSAAGMMLADRHVPPVDVANQLDRSRSTAHSYLCRLEDDDEAHRTGTGDQYRREPWGAPGAASPAVADLGTEEVAERCAKTVLAQQIGTWRDGLVAARFGPARQGVAA
jgi:hypothetical protein